MRRRSVAFLVLMALLSSAGLAVAQDEAVLLRWKLQEGESFRLEMKQDLNMKMNVQGQTFDTKMDLTIHMSWAVRKVENGNITLDQTIDRMQMNMTVPFVGEVKIDTQEAGKLEGLAKTVADSIMPLVGARITQVMTDRGQITDVSIDPKAAESLARNPQLKDLFSGEGLKKLFGQAAGVLPENPVRPGDSWNQQLEVPSELGKMNMDASYTYRGTEQRDGRELAHIATTVKMAFQGDQVQVKNQQASGAIYFDVAAGRMTDTSLDQKLTMTLTVAGQTVDQEVTTRLQLKITPVP